MRESDERVQMTDVRKQITDLILLHLHLLDVLLYALCPMLYALFVRRFIKHTAQRQHISVEKGVHFIR